MVGISVVTMGGGAGPLLDFALPLLSGQTERLIRVVDAPEPPKLPTPRIHAVHRRLSPDTIQQLIADYQAGTPSTQLMVTYDLGKGTVLRLLRTPVFSCATNG